KDRIQKWTPKESGKQILSEVEDKHLGRKAMNHGSCHIEEEEREKEEEEKRKPLVSKKTGIFSNGDQ
ncbi:hypothetical protein STEG23_012248, partial [Scotinomys teguina]